MKVFGIMVIVGTTYLLLYLFLNISDTSTNFPVFDTSSHDGQNVGMTGPNRKLKEQGLANENNAKNVVNLEDYNPIDPVVPSAKASIRPGPIQHATPLIPFIPKPSPPGHPMLRDSSP